MNLSFAFLESVSKCEIVTNRDRKSTRLNSSHDQISYAVFCLKKKKKCRQGSTGEECSKNTRGESQRSERDARYSTRVGVQATGDRTDRAYHGQCDGSGAPAA